MYGEAVIYIAILIGFVLLIVIIKLLPYDVQPREKRVLMYYKLDLKNRKIITISSASVEEQSINLNKNNYELIMLSQLEAFTNQQANLPDNSFLIALNDVYSYSLKRALPILIKEHISIIIFLPILVSSNNNQYQGKTVQQLNEFIFSEEFKNVFSYTQPNTMLLTTK